MRYLLIILLFVSAQAHSKIYRYAYFADFPFWESPLQPFKFATPLTKSDALKRIHIQVGYDEQNRVVDLQTRQGTQFKALGNSFNALYVHSVHTKVHYQDNQEIHQFYNRFGHRITAWGDVWTKTYDKDERGRYTKLTLLDRNERPVNNSWGIASYTWLHQSDASVIEERQNLTGELKSHRPGFEFERIRLFFDPQGHLRLMQNVDESFKLLASKSGASQYYYFYDSKGLFERWEIYDEKGNPAIGPSNTAGESYTRKNDGSKKISFFDQKGGPAIHWSGAVHWKIQEDALGNITERAYFDAQENPSIGNFKFSKIAYQWDKQGLHLKSRTLLDTAGKPTLHLDGYSKVKFFYTKEGLLKEQHFLDLEGKPVVNEFEKAAVIRIYYNKNGQRTGIDKLGVNGDRMMAK